MQEFESKYVCKKCNKVFSEDWRKDRASVKKNPTPVYCSRGCANSRIQTEEQNRSRSEKLKIKRVCKTCSKEICKKNKSGICIECLLKNKKPKKPKKKLHDKENLSIINWIKYGESFDFGLLDEYEENHKIIIYDDGLCATIALLKRMRLFFDGGDVLSNREFNSNEKKMIKYALLNRNNHHCMICGDKDIHKLKPLVFVLDHINGNPYDNRYENLRLICPNCDSQLDTYKSKNNGHGRISCKKYMRKNMNF